MSIVGMRSKRLCSHLHFRLAQSVHPQGTIYLWLICLLLSCRTVLDNNCARDNIVKMHRWALTQRVRWAASCYSLHSSHSWVFFCNLEPNGDLSYWFIGKYTTEFHKKHFYTFGTLIQRTTTKIKSWIPRNSSSLFWFNLLPQNSK